MAEEIALAHDVTVNVLWHQFENVRTANGLNAKKEWLKIYKSDELFRKTLKFLFDPSIVIGISNARVKKSTKTKGEIYIPFRFSALLDYLTENSTGKDEDIATIQAYINNNPAKADFIREIVTKSYKMGINSKTIDSVYGEDFLNIWKVQQAYPINRYELKDDEWFSLSQKLNGFHASYYRGKLISRQGREITGCQHIINVIEACGLQNWFIDGELIRKNCDEIPDEENFRLTVSIANSDIEDKSDLQFVYYDMMLADDFDKDDCKLTYAQRSDIMSALANSLMSTPFWKHFRMVTIFYEGTDKSRIKFWLDYADENDMEGLMLNRDTIYQKKRNFGILKIKSWKHCDLKVIGMEEGEGKYKGTLGALIVNYKGNELKLSGMSDTERDVFWDLPDDIIGKIVQVKYKQETQDKTGKKSLQFATYQCVRHDKTEESYN